MDLEKYRRLFVDEATDHLGAMAGALTCLEGGEAGSAEAIDTLFRMAHSIKGMAASLDYESVAILAHRLEDWMEPLRGGDSPGDAALELMGEAIRALEEMVGAVDREATAAPADGGLLARLADPPRRERAVPAPAAEPGTAGTPPPLPRSVRVRTEAVDRFLASVGELMQRQARLEELHRAAPLWDQHGEFGEQLDGMEHAVRELRRRALDIRTTPVRRVLERLPRVASELARELGKRVRVELRGEEVEVDRAILDHLDDPLLHLVRNAIDHGIETPAQRERAGKDPVGSLLVSASSAAGRLRVRLEEDGRGIDVESVRRRAVERGLLLEMVAEDLPPERICELIFEPGLSTREAVTEVSGRGVGMDVVKRTIEGLGGSVSLENRVGEGTAIELELPTMAALQRVIVLEVGSERVALPVSQLEAVLAVGEAEVERAGFDAFFVYKDEPLPLLDLAEHMGLRPLGGDRGNVLVLETRGFRFGLLVDRAVADLEVFVRETPEPLSCHKALGGVTILPDGDPVFLLEPAPLVESFV